MVQNDKYLSIWIVNGTFFPIFPILILNKVEKLEGGLISEDYFPIITLLAVLLEDQRFVFVHFA
jgi:hypothetical protein